MKLFILALLSSLSSIAIAGPTIQLSRDCAWGSFDAVEGDITFFDLNLDVQGKQKLEVRDCEILVRFPARSGQRLVVSEFQVEAVATLDNWGLALLTLQHNLNNKWRRKSEDTAQKPGVTDLRVQDRINQKMDCGKSAWLRTNITTAVRNGILFQDNANQVINLDYYYEPCNRW